MTKAFWTIVPNDTSVPNVNRPTFPALASLRYTNPGDLWVLPEGAGAANHRHLMVGSLAAPNFSIASKHTHIAFKNGAFSYQRLIHESESQHTHPDPVLSFFLCFVTCSDDDYTTLIGAPHNVRAVAQAVITQDQDGNDVIGDLESTAWTTAQRNAWSAALLTNLGIQIPAEIDRGRRLIAFLLDMSLARRNDNERGLR